MAVDTQAFAVSLGINTAICVVCFIVFSVLRTARLTRKFYAPKRYAEDVKHRPKRLPAGYLSWYIPVLTCPEDDLIQAAGLDAAVFIRVLRFGFTLMLWLSIWCCGVLLPVNMTGGGIAAERANNPKVVYSNIDKLYMTNVRAGSRRLWAHALSVYVVTFLILKLLWRFNQDLSRLRIKFLATIPKGGPSHTVLLSELPGIRAGTVLDTICHLMTTSVLRFAPQAFKDRVVRAIEATYGHTTGGLQGITRQLGRSISVVKLTAADTVIGVAGGLVSKDVLFPREVALDHLRQGGTSQSLVESEFRGTYGTAEVVAVNPVYNQRALEPLVAQYDQAVEALEELLDRYKSLLRRRKPVVHEQVRVVGALLGAWGMERYGKKPTKVDALEFYPARLAELRRLIREAEPAARRDFYPAAFVTFSTRFAHAIASTGLQSHDEAIWRVEEAPGEEEVVWRNLRMRAWERTLRSLAMWALFVVIVLFYGIWCTALQSLVNIKQLDRTPGIKQVIAIPFVRSLVMGVLPGLMLMIFMFFLPGILAVMNRFAGAVSLSRIDFGVVEKYFTFQLLTVFLATALAGTLLAQAKAIAKDPGDIVGVVQKIANAIPQQATFFMTWVMLNGLSSKPIAFLRVWDLVLFLLRSRLAASARARARLWQEQEQMFGDITTDHVMAVLFGIVFSIQAPLIAPVCLYYFSVNLAIEKYNALYVFSRPYESGGLLWAKMYRQIMVAVYIFQVVMLLQLGLRGFPYTPLVIPALPATLAFDRACVTNFRRPWQLLSLRAAAKLDELDKQATGHAGLDQGEREEVGRAYLSPVFKVDDEAYASLIAEAASVQQRIHRADTWAENLGMPPPSPPPASPLPPPSPPLTPPPLGWSA